MEEARAKKRKGTRKIEKLHKKHESARLVDEGEMKNYVEEAKQVRDTILLFLEKFGSKVKTTLRLPEGMEHKKN